MTGLTAGLLGVALSSTPGFRYADDGTLAAFLVVLIAFASYLPAEVGPASLGATFGAAAFGLFLFVPAVLAFDRLGDLEAGAWLGICTLLVPIGAAVVWTSERSLRDAARLQPARRNADPGLLPSLGGLALVLAGIWLPAENGGDSYWNLSSSGHALGILMLLLVALNALLVAAPFVASVPVASAGLPVAATTFGLVEAELIGNAFESFGSLGSGAWVGACGGALLLLGVAATRVAATRPEPEVASLSGSDA